jgi:hypothetical protein
MVQWRKRKRGTPNQIGKPFPVDKESVQQKKGLLDKLRGRFSGKHVGTHEHKYLEQLRDLIKEHTDPKESKLIDGILTESDAEYLAKKGLIEIDPYTDDISLTEAGQAYFLGEKMKEKKKVLKSLTEMEKGPLLEKREMEDEKGRND